MPSTSPNIIRQWIDFERAVLSSVNVGIRERATKALASHLEKLIAIAVAFVLGTLAANAWIGLVTSLVLLGLWVVAVYITTPARLHFESQEKIKSLNAQIERKQITEKQGKELAHFWRLGQEMYERRLPSDLDYLKWEHELMEWASDVILKLHAINLGESFIFESAGSEHRQKFNLNQDAQYQARRAQLGARLAKLKRIAGRYLGSTADGE